MATINLKPTIKQDLAFQKLHDPTTKFINFGGGGGGGKSWLGCEWEITNCYLYPGSRWFIGRKELTRLMQSTFVTFQKVCKFHGIPKSDWKLNGQYNYIQFKNGSRIDLLDVKRLPSDPIYERFGSLEYTGGWLEEAGEIEFLAFDVLKSRVGRHLNKDFSLPPKLLLTCNPSKNFLYRVFYKPWKENELRENYAFIQSLYSDNPHTAKEYGEMLAEIEDKATKERLMYGNWEYDDDPSALIEYDNIVDLFSNTAEEAKEKYLTADIARFGQDSIVIYLWQGLHLYKIVTFKHKSTDYTADKIRELAKTEKIPFSHIIVDEDGVGGGVKDQLKGIKGFINGSTPFKKENYENLKTQCYYLLAKKINNHAIAITCDDEEIKDFIIEELEQVKTKDADKDGKLKIIPKDKVKDLIGRSPDFSDAMMMRMYFEFKSKPKITFI